ncbi:MAG: iron-containing alcohol dehydrogenase [Candidatus Lokiarchaeota archaeon]|nr:iron-containing alcohol dehydrogenase [Candidatus Lokiarchaeota archaeon]
MEKKNGQIPDQISEQLKALMNLLKGRAPGGLLTAFRSPQIIFGMTALNRIKNYLDGNLEEGERRVLIVTDDFTEKFASPISKVLGKINIDSRVWSGVKQEVPINTIDEAVKICEDFKPRVFVAIGGGSVLDTTKALMIKYEKPETNLFMVSALEPLGLRKKIKYFVAIPTTSGTGSEVTLASMLTDISRDPPKKFTVSHPELIPDYAVLITDFVKDMPPFLTMATGLDALAHAAGSYVSNIGTPFADAMNIYAIKEIIKFLPRAVKYGAKDIEARAHMQIAASMAGLGFIHSRIGIDHALGHSLGKVLNVHHGLCVGMFLPYTIAFQMKISERWKDLCPLFGVNPKNKDNNELSTEFLQSIKEFIHSLDGPVCVKEIMNPIITEEDYYKNLDLLVNYAETDPVAFMVTRYIDSEVIKRIFEYAWDGKTIDF